ncbi:MAG: amidohydrolase, partial [Actinomycetia bacterium]|nr:amidohydrolase [Actinomycetes bacterium]
MSTAFFNGSIHGHPFATAVLVDGTTIAAIGGDDLAKDATDVIDLAGRPLFPGFQDAHVHPSMAGIYLASCNLAE